MKNFTTLALLCALVLAGCAGNSAQAQADYELGVKYLHGTGGVQEDLTKAVQYLTKSSDAGNADAEVTLGYLYLKGDGVTQDSAKAVALFTKSATAGNRDAQYNTGLSYVRGEGVAIDFDKAFDWFEMAAKQDDVGSQYNLGVMYFNGEGTVRDPIAAYAWFKLANDKGYEGAKEGMDTAKASLTSDQIQSLDVEVAKVAATVKKPAPVLQPSGVGSHPL